MKVALLVLILPVLLCLPGCTSSDTPDTGASKTTWGGGPSMSGSDSNASENRY